MKRIYPVFILLIAFSLRSFSQTPQNIPYQAVARDASGNLLANQNVCVQFRIYNQLAGGTLLYEEHQAVTTNKLGLFTLNIGAGTYDGGTASSLSGINWGSSGAFMETGLDITGVCSGYTTLGRSQMLSVPYALYAGSAASAGGTAGGDLTGNYPNPTLAASGVTANTYGSATQVPQVTVDSKGRVTSASNVTISGTAPGGNAGGDLTGTYPNPSLNTSGVTAGTYGTSSTYPVVTVDAKGRVTNVTTDALPTTLPPSGTAGGDLTGSYPSPTLITSGVTANTYGSATQVPQLTVDAKGRVTSASNQTITPAGIGALSTVSVSSPLSGNGTSGSPVSCTTCVTTGTVSALGNPSSTIGLSVVNGSGTTGMFANAAPALSQSIVPTWTGTHTFSNHTYSALFTGGNVGIGTPAPATPLDVAGTGTVGIRYLKSGSADARISMGDNSNQIWSWSCGWGASSGGAAGDFSLIHEGNSGTVIYFQNSTNNVGIGTASPAYNLDVSGTERVTGNLTVGGAITGRVWSTNLPANVNYGYTPVALLSTTITSHGGTLVITGKVLDQTNNNNENRNYIYLYRTTSSSGYTGTGSTLLDTWAFWQATNGEPISESGLVTYSEQLSAGTYYYWLVAACEVSGFTRTALPAGTRLIVYEF